MGHSISLGSIGMTFYFLLPRNKKIDLHKKNRLKVVMNESEVGLSPQATFVHHCVVRVPTVYQHR